MSSKALRFISVLGIFAAVFPFVVLCAGTGLGEYVWWHYLAIYAVLAAFFGWGVLCASWGTSQAHSRGFRPVALFMSRAAAVLPVIIYCVVCVTLEFSGALFLYIIPAQLIIFKGGHSSVGRDYNDVFGRGWFALYFMSAVITSVILWFTRDDAIISAGNYQLCFGFGVLIVISAILTNQTNIDTCTHQRDAGKMALPVGLRLYNTKLCAAVSVITVSLFLLVPPLAKLLAHVIKSVISWILVLIQGFDRQPVVDDVMSGAGGGDGLPYAEGAAAIMDLLYIVLGAFIITLAIKYRRQIGEFFRDTFSFLFREREDKGDISYEDEYILIPEEKSSLRKKRRLEHQLYRDYIRENDPVRKYRIGYRLMLVRLSDTPFAVVGSDNTDIHRVKGENGLRSEKVRNIVEIYNSVRYGELVPTAEQLSFEESFIEEIRRKI